ncbi:MotA/TolQ/ExbB proton channel family protein [Oleiphilus messinensis]|uniref:MotA/TolQ/ExbB proton channel family protein n=1 Tax=Oleiphilus messinensis TaxID=141451 RepID=A0A1Y0I9N6_9GAMM|nr:MotA/TolQ/ExbB proton channel family protein [Oleiphilus messinensis]ARU56950.1 MotA/TolQ/ExbB proton channel family protein [Oleiphilus messinensis]
MKQLGKVLTLIIIILSVLQNKAQAESADVLNLDKLLERIKEGQLVERKQDTERVTRFKRELDQQAQLLKEAELERDKLLKSSSELEEQLKTNQEQISQLRTDRDEKLGELKALFGVLQQTAIESKAEFNDSLTQLNYPERTAFLDNFSDKMSRASALPSVDEIRKLWFELALEVTESGRITTFTADYRSVHGDLHSARVTRLGVFNIVKDGAYLNYDPQTGKLIELAAQPADRFVDTLSDLPTPQQKTFPLALDPSRGQLLEMLTQLPDFEARIRQGGIVGYIIIALGMVAVLIALERGFMLLLLSFKVRSQLRRPDKPGNNPLGRILACYNNNSNADLETLELRMGELMLREIPTINRRVAALKMIAVVAPLLGLLGTVTGMIVTFQSISLFGTGDPKLMASGISQALITTVQGLSVAIPVLLFHGLVAAKARGITEVLEYQAAGLIAEQAQFNSAESSLS